MPGPNEHRRAMNIALLGGSGFLGRNLLPVLTGAGHRCTVLTRDPERCRDLRLQPGATLVRSNAFDVDALAKQLEGHDAVINLVGILNESGRSGKGFEKAHVTITNNLLEAGKQAGVKRFIQVSALGANTDSPQASHYLKSKGEAEKLVKKSPLETTIFRPSVIFGRSDAFFNRFAAILKWVPVLPLACPNAKLQPVWVGDVVAAISRSLDAPETVGKAYPLVGPTVVSLIDVVRFTARSTGRKRLIIPLPDFLSRLQGLVCDFVPGKPFSSDNYKSLKIDNVSKKNGLKDLGIDPRPMQGYVSAYLAGSSRQQRLDAIRRASNKRR